MTNKTCSCPGRGDGSLRWPCKAHPPKQNEAKSDQIIVSGAPTEAQARAIRKLDNVQAILAGAQASVTDAVRELSLTSAALTAAQGAAPQVESDERIQAWERLIQHPVWRSCFEEERPLIDSVMERIDNLAELEMTVNELAPAPVLPSSGVDEAALAEVIASVTDLWDDPLDEVHDIPQIARAVAEWLKR